MVMTVATMESNLALVANLVEFLLNQDFQRKLSFLLYFQRLNCNFIIRIVFKRPNPFHCLPPNESLWLSWSWSGGPRCCHLMADGLQYALHIGPQDCSSEADREIWQLDSENKRTQPLYLKWHDLPNIWRKLSFLILHFHSSIKIKIWNNGHSLIEM